MAEQSTRFSIATLQCAPALRTGPAGDIDQLAHKVTGVSHEIAYVCNSRQRRTGWRRYHVSPNARSQPSCVLASLWRGTRGPDGLHLQLARAVCSFGQRYSSHLPDESLLLPCKESDARANLQRERPEAWQPVLKHDPEKREAVFRKDYAQTTTPSAMTIHPNLIAL